MSYISKVIGIWILSQLYTSNPEHMSYTYKVNEIWILSQLSPWSTGLHFKGHLSLDPFSTHDLHFKGHWKLDPFSTITLEHMS
jgi:hypothetical protein